MYNDSTDLLTKEGEFNIEVSLFDERDAKAHFYAGIAIRLVYGELKAESEMDFESVARQGTIMMALDYPMLANGTSLFVHIQTSNDETSNTPIESALLLGLGECVANTRELFPIN